MVMRHEAPLLQQSRKMRAKQLHAIDVIACRHTIAASRAAARHHFTAER